MACYIFSLFSYHLRDWLVGNFFHLFWTQVCAHLHDNGLALKVSPIFRRHWVLFRQIGTVEKSTKDNGPTTRFSVLVHSWYLHVIRSTDFPRLGDGSFYQRPPGLICGSIVLVWVDFWRHTSTDLVVFISITGQAVQVWPCGHSRITETTVEWSTGKVVQCFDIMQLCAPIAVLDSQSSKLTICRQTHWLAKTASQIQVLNNAMSS